MKFYLLSLLTLASFLVSKAQVSYSFSAVSGTYVPIAGGTSPTLVNPDPNNYDVTDEGFANNIPLGFTFNYNGVNYTKVHLMVNGFLALGNGFDADPNELYYYDTLAAGPLSPTNVRPVIAPFWGDHDIQAVTNL